MVSETENNEVEATNSQATKVPEDEEETKGQTIGTFTEEQRNH